MANVKPLGSTGYGVLLRTALRRANPEEATFELTQEGKAVWIRASQDAGGPISRANANRVKLVRLE